MKKLFILFILTFSNMLWAYELTSIQIDKVKFNILQHKNLKKQNAQKVATFFSESVLINLKNNNDITLNQVQMKSDQEIINIKKSTIKNNQILKIMELFDVDMFLKKSQTRLKAKNGLIDSKAQIIYFNNDVQVYNQKSSQLKCQKAIYLQKLEKLELTQCEAHYNL